ncbi:MAG: ribosome biogenesis factor YjgA [Pseudomonadales bacterium]
MQNFDNDQFEDDLGPSKSQKKRDMHSLQQLCDELAQLNTETWGRLELPEPLLESIQTAARIKSSSARNRQLRHAAKILAANEDLLESVKTFLEARKNQARHDQQRQKLVEQWRDRLLSDDQNALSDLFDSYPETDRQELSTLARNARKELQSSKPPAQQRKLFKYLRDFVIT